MVGERGFCKEKNITTLASKKQPQELISLSLLSLFLRPECRARKRHINLERINFLKVGTTLGQSPVNQREKVYISCVSRRRHKLFGPVNTGTRSCLSQGHLDVNQSKKFMFMCPFFSRRMRSCKEQRFFSEVPFRPDFWAKCSGPFF